MNHGISMQLYIDQVLKKLLAHWSQSKKETVKRKRSGPGQARPGQARPGQGLPPSSFPTILSLAVVELIKPK